MPHTFQTEFPDFPADAWPELPPGFGPTGRSPDVLADLRRKISA